MAGRFPTPWLDSFCRDPCASGSSAVLADSPLTYLKDVRPLLEAHCFKCHGPDKQRGGVNLAAFTDEKAVQARSKLWRKVASQLDALAMPPAKAPQPTGAQRELLARWVRDALDAADCSAERDPGPAVIRRLDRSEYNRTLHDLLGVDFDAATAVGMTDENTGGFDNLAEGLDLPPALMEKYFAAADKALDRFYGLNEAGKPLPPNDPAARKAEQLRKAVLFVTSGPGLSKHAAARQVIARFLRRAYRRPPKEDEVDRYMRLFDRADGRGERFEEGVRLMLKAALASPYFLYRVEQDRARPGRRRRTRSATTNWPCGCRTSSGPRCRTTSCRPWPTRASSPTRTSCTSRSARMLNDPKARALTDNFGVQWLQLRKLADARPSTEFFPTFNQPLRQAMYDEATTFFDKLREEDRPVLDLLDADYTYLNEDLAKHYGISGVQGRRCGASRCRRTTTAAACWAWAAS